MPFRRRRRQEPQPYVENVQRSGWPEDAHLRGEDVEDPDWPEDPDDPVVKLRRRLEGRLEELEFTLEELASEVRDIDQRVTDLEQE